MEIVKDDRKAEGHTFAKDKDGNFDLDSVFLVQVINHKGEIGYIGKQDGKDVTIGRICHLVTKFGDYKSAKAFANTIKGAKTNILGRHRIERIILEQEAQDQHNTVPLEKVEGEMYHIIVKEAQSGNLVGYITYKPETDEYSVIPGTEKAAFWNSVETAEAFIAEATKTFLSQHPDLKLEKVKYK